MLYCKVVISKLLKAV